MEEMTFCSRYACSLAFAFAPPPCRAATSSPSIDPLDENAGKSTTTLIIIPVLQLLFPESLDLLVLVLGNGG
jgi:hypothetical protein